MGPKRYASTAARKSLPCTERVSNPVPTSPRVLVDKRPLKTWTYEDGNSA